jgi:hypothetical protein
MIKKHFVLVVKYISGECAFLTDTPNLQRALKEFDIIRKKDVSDSVLFDKSTALPEVQSAKLVRLYYNKADKFNG